MRLPSRDPGSQPTQSLSQGAQGTPPAGARPHRHAASSGDLPGSNEPTTSIPAEELEEWREEWQDDDEGFPSSGDRTTVMSTPDPTTVFPSRGAPAGGGPVRTPIMPDHRAQAGARSPAGTWSQAAPPPARWGEPVESPLPPAVPRPQTGTQSSAGRWSQAAQPASQSPSWRAPQPTPRPQEAYQPAARPQAEPQPAPWGGPVESPRPVLPPPPARRHTAALPLGTLMLVVTIGLLGWGTYTFLPSLHILDLVQGTVDKTIWTAGGAVIGGAVLAFFTVIVSFVAVARAKPKTAALTLMLGAFFLPLGACAAGVHYGWPVLKENTLAEARQMAGTVNPDDVDALIGQVEDLGINVPWRGELMEILRGESQ